MTEEQKQHRREWVKALRSGRYSQWYGDLKKPGEERFCVLGVACDVYDPTGWDHGFRRGYLLEGKLTIAVLPDPLMDYYGVDEDEQRALLKLNDGNRQDFSTLARSIEMGTND